MHALDPPAYWLEIAQPFSWDRAPGIAMAGVLGNFRYFSGALSNLSTSCLDRWPAERVALRYEREQGLKQSWTFGAVTDAAARFAAALQDLGGSKGGRVAVYASNVPASFIAIHACYRPGAVASVLRQSHIPAVAHAGKKPRVAKNKASYDAAGSAKHSQTNRYYPRAAEAARNCARTGRVGALFAHAPNSRENE